MTDTEHPAENDAPRVRPVRPWQHWRFALTVTFCWLARRHFLVLVRESRYPFYDCRVCRTHYADVRGTHTTRIGQQG